MTDIDIREALDRATRHLSPAPDLLEQVRRGGHDRLVRRRSLVAAGLATVVAGGAGARWWPRLHRPAPTGSWLLDRPTAGDLADDARYLRQVQAAWSTAFAGPSQSVLRGDPHIIWAGSTPAGPAAWVAQQYTSDTGAFAVVMAFAEPTSTGPKIIVQSTYASGEAGSTCPSAVLVGEKYDVLVVLDIGESIRWSSDLRYLSDGRIERRFTPVAFTDGAAVLRVPPQRTRVSVALESGSSTAPTPLPVLNADNAAFPDSKTPGASVMYQSLPDPAHVWPADPAKSDQEADAWVAGPLRPYLDHEGYQPQVAGPAWVIRATTPDGRRLSLRTPSAYDSKLRVLVVIGQFRGATHVVYGGELHPQAPLPIAVRLPDKQGVLVAGDQVKLKYRTTKSQWLPVSGEAALLPDSAARIQVTRHTGQRVELALP